MRNIIKVFIFTSLLLFGCGEDKNEDIKVKFSTPDRYSISRLAHLWGAPSDRLHVDSTNVDTIYRWSATSPEVITVRKSPYYASFYLEPGDFLEINFENNKFVISGDSDAVSRNELLLNIAEKKNILLRYKRAIKYRKNRPGAKEIEPVDTEDVINQIGDYISNNTTGVSESFKRFLEVDFKYFKIFNEVEMPNYPFKTYFKFSDEDLAKIAQSTEDAQYDEAVMSIHYRQVAKAYQDYFRINDPENRMKKGIDYLGNEMRITEYFKGEEVQNMLKASNLKSIGYDHFGDEKYIATAKTLPQKWYKSLEYYFNKRTNAKGRKIDAPADYPNIKGVDINGKEVSISDFKGKWIFIDCWATW